MRRHVNMARGMENAFGVGVHGIEVLSVRGSCVYIVAGRRSERVMTPHVGDRSQPRRFTKSLEVLALNSNPHAALHEPRS